MTSSQRIAAFLFGLGSATFIATISAYLGIYGAPEGSGSSGAITTADSARHMLENRALIRSIWIAELLAVSVHAIAAFLLAGRPGRGNSLAPLGWVTFGVGSIIYLGLYGVMLGAYWPAADVADQAPAILESANAMAVAFFLIANIPINLGLAVIFAAEARAIDPAVPRWIGLAASLCGTLVCLVMIYALASDGGMAVALSVAPLGGLLFLVSAWFGFRLAFLSDKVVTRGA